MTIHHPLLLFLSTVTAAAAGPAIQKQPLQRHRILNETPTPPTVNDRLTPSAFNDNGDACSCSPTKFTFRINLTQSCDNNDISENAGIESTFCIIEDVSSNNSREDSNQEPVRQLKSSPVVEITSVQFLEFRPDPSLEVSYTDDKYLNATLTDGNTFTFYSSSSYLPSVTTEQQEDYVPGGVSMILQGRTEDGTVKRNRLYWLYDAAITDCLENLIIPGIYAGDAIGWVVVDTVAGPWPQFCPAASPTSPTITPLTFDPTAAPTSYAVLVETSKSKSSKSSLLKSSSKSDKEEVDAKADKYSSKSSKSSASIYDNYSSKGDKESVDLSSKSGKISYNANYTPGSKSMSYSLSMHSMPYVSKTEKGVILDDNTITSSTHWKSSADSYDVEAQDVDSKPNGYNAKAYKILSPGAKTGKGAVLSSKANKSYVIAESDDIGSVSMSHSLSMYSDAPSKSSSHHGPQYHAQIVDSNKYSGKSSKIDHVVEANSFTSSGAGSKSSKSYGVDHAAVEPDSMSYSLSMSSSERPPSQQNLESTGNAEKNQANSNGSKSSKTGRKASHPSSTSRDLMSEWSRKRSSSEHLVGEVKHEEPVTNDALKTALAKSGKSMSLDVTNSVRPSSGPTASYPPHLTMQSKSYKTEEVAVSVSKSGKSEHGYGLASSMSYSLSMSSSYSMPDGKESSFETEFQSSKSSKSKETSYVPSKSGKSENNIATEHSENNTAPEYNVSKSGKSAQGYGLHSSLSGSLSMSSSYSSLSMSSSNSMPNEKSDSSGLKQNSFETGPPTGGSNEPASSPSVDTDFGFTSDNTSTVSEIRSPNSGATPRSLGVAMMFLLLQLAI